ncbi:MAG: hypothetical protein CL610_24050 [Anaerolineaceae bacterium]|nr:hypothetical protein [Anaerolineaceae bacterium]
MKLMKRATILVLVVGLLAAFAGATAAQEYPPNTLTVDGFGQAFGEPDVVIVQLGVQTSSSDVMEAYNNANIAIQNVIDALKAAGIEDRDLQTTGLYLYQDTPFNPQTGEPGTEPIYRVQNSLTVTVRDVDTVGDIINIGVEAGANNIGGIPFSIDDPAALEQQAREAAIGDARQRAEELASLMGVELGSPSIIVESNDGQPPILYDRAQAGFGGSGVPVEEGQLSVGVVVKVTFNFE